MEFSIEEWLHSAVYKHLFHVLNAAYRAQLWEVHIPTLVDATY